MADLREVGRERLSEVGHGDPATDAAARTDQIGMTAVRRVVAWAATFAAVFALLAAWSLATPKYAAPDEPAHAYRAASLVRGQLLGVPVNRPDDPRVVVGVPATLTAVGPGCFAFHPQIPASCMGGWPSRPGYRRVTTYTGRYPPLYYLAVGLPTLLTTGGSMLLWMRLAGDLVNALFLTVGFAMLRRLRSPWALAAGAVAVTPMVLFIASVINPSGLEICAAFALWCSLLALLKEQGAGSTSALTWAAVSAAVMESTRGLSPVLMAGTVVATAAVAGAKAVAAAGPAPTGARRGCGRARGRRPGGRLDAGCRRAPTLAGGAHSGHRQQPAHPENGAGQGFGCAATGGTVRLARHADPRLDRHDVGGGHGDGAGRRRSAPGLADV